MSVFFKSRKAIACLPAICLLAVAVHSAMNTDLKITPKYDDSSVEVALIDLDELMPPPPPLEPLLELVSSCNLLISSKPIRDSVAFFAESATSL